MSSRHGWHASFIAEHLKFGKRLPSGKLAGRKDQVDATVAGYLYLTDPENDTELPDISRGDGERLQRAAARLWAPTSSPFGISSPSRRMFG